MTETRREFQNCDFFLQGSTPHQGNQNSTPGRNKIHQGVLKKTNRCQGGQNSTREGKITHQVCDRGVSVINTRALARIEL